MESAESLRRRIRTVQDLESVVKTMKALAAVSLRQYERAVGALADYNRTIEMGLQVVLQRNPGRAFALKPAPRKKLGAVVFGSDQGMCGALNDQIVSYAVKTVRQLAVAPEDRAILAVGLRAATRLEDVGLAAEDHLPVPGSAAGITPIGQELVLRITDWQEQRGIDHVMLFHSRPLSGASFRPTAVEILPVDREWLRKLEQKSWPTRLLPTFTMDWDGLFSSLIRQYLFVSLYRAFAESLASENASRLASMQAAERNIEDRLRELNTEFHQQRQMAITSELLDIVAGFEALTGKQAP